VDGHVLADSLWLDQPL